MDVRVRTLLSKSQANACPPVSLYMSSMSRLLHALARSRKARQTSSTSSSLRNPSSKSVCTAHQKIQGCMCQVCRHRSGSPAGQVHPPGGDVSLMAAHPTARQIKGQSVTQRAAHQTTITSQTAQIVWNSTIQQHNPHVGPRGLQRLCRTGKLPQPHVVPPAHATNRTWTCCVNSKLWL